MLAPRDADIIDRHRDHDRRIRRLEVRKNPGGAGGPFVISHTFSVGGELYPGLVIPKHRFFGDVYDDAPFAMRLLAVDHEVITSGSVTVDWQLNGATVAPTSPGVDLVADDRLWPTITAGTAVDVAFHFAVRIRPG